VVYQGVVFDLDGTLIDSEGIAQKAMEQTFRGLGFSLGDDDFAYMSGRSSRELVPVFLERREIIDLAVCQETLQSYRINHTALWESEVRLMPYASEVLHQLYGNGILLALATGSRSLIVDRFLEKFDFRHLFRCVIPGDAIAKSKPDPEGYNLAVERLGLARERILVVEDTQVGLAAAKEAKLACAVIPNAYSAGQDFSAADYLLSSLQEILQFF
jgi:HAD superfamily hydrolase (TIGR01509 family)